MNALERHPGAVLLLLLVILLFAGYIVEGIARLMPGAGSVMCLLIIGMAGCIAYYVRGRK